MMGRWSTLLYAALVFNGMQAVTSNPLGGNQCPNIKGEYETCGYLQFCSESALDKGCRDCSEIYQYWCDDHYEQFRDKYPSCEILCANEKLAKAENALNQSRLDNAKKEQELRSGQLVSPVYMYATFFLATVIVIMTIIIQYCYRLFTKQQRRKSNSSSPENIISDNDSISLIESDRTTVSNTSTENKAVQTDLESFSSDGQKDDNTQTETSLIQRSEPSLHNTGTPVTNAHINRVLNPQGPQPVQIEIAAGLPRESPHEQQQQNHQEPMGHQPLSLIVVPQFSNRCNHPPVCHDPRLDNIPPTNDADINVISVHSS